MKGVTPYSSHNESKKEQVSRMFNNISGYYDFLNHFLSLGIDRSWRKRTVLNLTDKKYSLILDLATGTADLALAISEKADCDQIIGIDIADQMLAIGRKKIEKAGKSDKITLENGDAENLRFESGSADAVTVAFGVRNFEDLTKGLKEIHRVLNSDGKVVILEFSKPSIFPFKQLYNLYFRYVLPLIGRFTSKDPRAYRYLYDSVQAFPSSDEFLDLLSHVGFKRCYSKSLTLGICHIYIAHKS